ncbi:MAG TPA: hypothetical protein VL625_10580 [Patescibacteria group bacterium]|nr:hypothetical protein [Patescibacteria group bacterium]
MGGVWNIMLAKGVKTGDSAFAPVRNVLARNHVELTPVPSLKGTFMLTANGAAVDNSRASAIIDEMMMADPAQAIIDGALRVTTQPRLGR